jgi:anti-anti-sigma factor
LLLPNIPHQLEDEVTMSAEFTNESLSIDIAGDGAIVVHGDIDMAGGPLLESSILQREPDSPVVIDLADVFFIDSSGLRSLLDAARRARARDTDVVLRSIGPEVARLLEITGTTGQFVIEGRRD